MNEKAKIEVKRHIKLTTAGRYPACSATDNASGVTIIWDEGKFNDSQQVLVPRYMEECTAQELAAIMREIGDYLAKNRPELCC